MVCTGGVNRPCQGDGGAPLVCVNFFVVNSFISAVNCCVGMHMGKVRLLDMVMTVSSSPCAMTH